MKLHLRFGDGLRFRDVGRAQGGPVNDPGLRDGQAAGQTAEQVGAQDDRPSASAPQFRPRPQTSTRTARPLDDLAPSATAAELAELKEKQILADAKWAWDEQLREIKNAHRHQNYPFSGPTPMARPPNPLPPAPQPSTWSATRAVTPSDDPAPGGTAAKIAELQMQVARLQAQIEADRVEVARLQNDAHGQGHQNYSSTPPSAPPIPMSYPQTYPFREPLDNNSAPTWTLLTAQQEQDDPFLCATAPAQNAWMTPPRRATMITPDLTPEEIRAQRVLAAEQRRRARSYRQRENLASLNHMDAHEMSDRYAGMQLERPVVN
ncbi:hypothetical protein B0H13DRAFT_1957529 [Mycena leptocephala]|nr:hypothetical protein B0H13DRAFT_1957529 [Mycena leptocephala]